MDAEISFNRFSQERATREMVATTPLLARAAAKWIASEELTPQENVMLGQYTSAIITSTEYAWKEHQSGRTDDFDLQELVRRIDEKFWSVATVWDRMKQGALDPDFVAAVEQELKQ